MLEIRAVRSGYIHAIGWCHQRLRAFDETLDREEAQRHIAMLFLLRAAQLEKDHFEAFLEALQARARGENSEPDKRSRTPTSPADLAAALESITHG